MKILHALFHLSRADFFERTRRYSFLLTLAAIIGIGVLVNNGTLSLSLGPGDRNPLSPYFRGELNSAWIGTMTVMVINCFLGLFGFFLVSNCIKRDINTCVGQIIATSPVSRTAYLVGKWISNFLVLAVLVLILALAAVVMVLLQSETALDLEALLMPFLAVALPYMALIAALAVVFETVPWLRGAVGNVVYFFLWLLIISVFLLGAIDLPFVKDPLGTDIFQSSLHSAASAAYPNDWIGQFAVGGAIATSQIKIFSWSGLDWTLGIVAGQWFWAVVGLGLVMLSGLWFVRFDPSREGRISARKKVEGTEEGQPAAPRIKLPDIALPSLSPLVSKLAQLNPFLGVLFAELRMLLNGRRWWWWVITAGLIIGIFTFPVEITRAYLIPIVWLLPLAIWSEMGNRERKNNTALMVFSSSRPVLRQLPAAWLAGVLATALLGIGAAAFFVVNGEFAALAGWAGAVVFVPSLALALGVFSSSNRIFEVVYLLWWYIGPFTKTAGMDFTSGVNPFYLLAAAGLLLTSAFWRSRQVRV
jgi:ABC-type transport system involved in multi-copper enzyme maturation permease subunit